MYENMHNALPPQILTGGKTYLLPTFYFSLNIYKICFFKIHANKTYAFGEIFVRCVFSGSYR